MIRPPNPLAFLCWTERTFPFKRWQIRSCDRHMELPNCADECICPQTQNLEGPDPVAGPFSFLGRDTDRSPMHFEDAAAGSPAGARSIAASQPPGALWAAQKKAPEERGSVPARQVGIAHEHAFTDRLDDTQRVDFARLNCERCSDSARICASVAAKQNSIRDAGIRRRWKSRRTRRSISGPSARPAAPVRCARACSRVSASARASKLDPDCRSHCELFAGLPACDVGRLETPDGLTIYALLCSELYDRDGTPYTRA